MLLCGGSVPAPSKRPSAVLGSFLPRRLRESFGYASTFWSCSLPGAARASGTAGDCQPPDR